MRKKSLVALLLALMMMVVTPLEALAVTDAVSENDDQKQTTVEQTAELEGEVVSDDNIKVELDGGSYKLSWEAVTNAYNYELVIKTKSEDKSIQGISEDQRANGYSVSDEIEGAVSFEVNYRSEELASYQPSGYKINAYLGYLSVTGNGTTSATITWKGEAGELYLDGNPVGATGNSYTCSTAGKHTAYVKKVDSSVSPEKTYKSEEVSFTVYPQTADVTGLVAYASNGAVDLDWNDVSGATYKIYVNGGYYTTVNGSNASIAVAQDTGYTFGVKAVANGIESVNMATTTGASVRTMYINITFKSKAKLKSHSGGKVTTVFPKGFRTTAFEFNKGCYHFYYGGRIYYAKAIRTKKQSIAGWSGGWYYPTADAEHYVNARGLSSKTGWLIWTNLYTQHTYIFTGSAYNWHCVNHFACSTGAARTPTDTGITKIKKKIKKRHSLPYWNMCARFSLHGKNKKWPIGAGPRSGGCVRNYNENAYWIYKNCPKGTTVCVY